jgi:hypothetical protein
LSVGGKNQSIGRNGERAENHFFDQILDRKGGSPPPPLA